MTRFNVQEKFWIGNFGTKYIKRNSKPSILKSNIIFFKNCTSKLNKKKNYSLIEYGSNIGLNLIALKKVLKLNKVKAVEINKNSFYELTKHKFVEAKNISALNFTEKIKYDLVLTKGFLIHINPNKLKKIYKILYESCKKKGHILICEYYNPTPLSLKYRGFKNVLFKRDFAGEMMKKYSNLKLIDYAFSYHKDKYYQNDITWFLLKKL